MDEEALGPRRELGGGPCPNPRCAGLRGGPGCPGGFGGYEYAAFLGVAPVTVTLGRLVRKSATEVSGTGLGNEGVNGGRGLPLISAMGSRESEKVDVDALGVGAGLNGEREGGGRKS